MKRLLAGTILALGLLAGAATAAPVTQEAVHALDKPGVTTEDDVLRALGQPLNTEKDPVLPDEFVWWTYEGGSWEKDYTYRGDRYGGVAGGEHFLFGFDPTTAS